MQISIRSGIALGLAAILFTGSASAGLVAEYTFSGNADDTSGNANHGSVHGATLTTDRDGNLNSAYAFDGANDYISTGNFTDTWNQWTVDFWFKANALPSSGSVSVMVEREVIGGYHDLEIGLNANGNLYMENDLTSSMTSSQLLPLNIWHNVMITYDGTARNIFINGILDSTSIGGNAFVDVTAPLLIGKHANNSYPSYFNGAIDDIRIYDEALNPVSEPGTLAMLFLGMAGFGYMRGKST